MTVAVYVDDQARGRTDNVEGKTMQKELEEILADNTMEIKTKKLRDHPEGIEFAGRLVRSVNNVYGRGLALTQPKMVDQITSFMKENSIDMGNDMTWLHITKGWTQLKAAQDMKDNKDRCDATKYLQLLGMGAWTNHTSIRSAMTFILASYSHNPGEAEYDILKMVVRQLIYL